MINNLDELFVVLFLKDKATYITKDVEVSLEFCAHPKRIHVNIQHKRLEGCGAAVNSVAEAKSMIRDSFLRYTGKAFPEKNPEVRTWYIQLRNHKYYPLCVSSYKPELVPCDDCYAVNLRYGRYPELDWDRDEQNPDIIYIPKNVVWSITDREPT